MIILNLIVAGDEPTKAMARYLLQTKYAVQVVLAKPSTLYELDIAGNEVSRDISMLQFVTKSVLFNEIEERLKKEFPMADFRMYAAPAILVSTALYERIRSSVPGNFSVNTQGGN